MFRPLFQLRRAVRHNRWRSLGYGARVGVVAGLAAALVSLALLGDALLRPAEPHNFLRRVEAWSFWCMAVTALVFGYTSFEVLYRDSVGRRLGGQPIHPAALYVWKVTNVYRTHLPLLLIPIVSGASLLLHGHTVAWLQGVGTVAGTWAWGLGAAVVAHVYAGASLLGGAGRLKQYLAQGFGPPETAFLFYSPAFALTAGLMVGMLTELSILSGTLHGNWRPLMVVGSVSTVGVFGALIWAGRQFARCCYRVEARFSEAEILPPWREGALPRRYVGAGFGRALNPSARTLWWRALVQYRRRFRVMLPLLVICCGVIFVYALNTADTAGGALRLSVVTVALGVLVFTPVFRLCGPELGVRYDARALPVPLTDERRVQWLLAASEWLPLALVSSLAGLWAGLGSGALVVLATVLGGFVLMNTIAIPIVLRVAPQVGRVSWALRGGVLLVLGAMSALLRMLGA